MKKYCKFLLSGLLLVLASTVVSVYGVTADTIEKLHIQGEDFVNEQGEPVRFWGFNLVSLYPTHEQADSIAKQLHSYGVNVVRPHHTTRNAQYNWNSVAQGGSGVGALIRYSNNTTRTPNEQAYERFDYFNFKLREKGIYTRLSLDGTRSYLPGDVDILATDAADRKAWYDAMEVLNKLYWEQSRDLRRMLPTIDERVALLNEEFMEYFLTHENPYTQLTYGQDPQTLTLEVANETSAEYTIVAGNRFVRPDGALTYGDGTKISAEDAAKLQYWEDKLIAKWKQYLISIGFEEGQHFDFYTGLTDDSRKKIRTDFLRKLDEDYFLRIKKLVREKIGCDTPITYSTFWRGETNLKMHVENGDYIEEHSYSDPLVPGSLDDLFKTAAQQTRIAGMPYFIGEINQKESLVNIPSRTTLLFSSAVYGSFYNWTGINFFAWNHGDQYLDESGNAQGAFRIPDLSTADSRSFLIGEMQKDTMMLDHLRTTGILYRKGYVRQSTQKKTTYVDEPYGASSYAPLMAPKYVFQSGWQSIHGIYKEFTPENKSIPLTQALSPQFQAAAPSPVISDTNEVIKDVEKKQLRVQAPQAEGFSGFTYGGETVSGMHLEARGQEGSATVLLVSGDEKELSDSAYMILSSTAVQHGHREQLNQVAGSEYQMTLFLKNIKQAGQNQHWQFEVTRPEQAARRYDLTAAPDGRIALPSIPWQEGELRLIDNSNGLISYALRSEDGQPLSNLPVEGGNVSVSVCFGESLEKPARLIAAVYDAKELAHLSYQLTDAEESFFEVEQIVLPEQEMEQIAQVHNTQYLDETAGWDIGYEYGVQGYCAGQPVGEMQYIKRNRVAASGMKPAPAEDLKVSDLRGNSVTLSWTQSKDPDIDGYDVYRDGALVARQIVDTTYVDTALQPQTLYVYEIKAVREGIQSMAVSARVSTPEDTDLIFQFYKNGVYGKGATYNRPDDTAQLLTDTVSAGQATEEVPEGSRVLRYKLSQNSGGEEPDRMPYVNIIWGRDLSGAVSYSLEELRETAAIKLFVNLLGIRKQTQIGFLNQNDDGTVSSVRLPLEDYIETTNPDYVGEGEPLAWQEVIIPISDFISKGNYYQQDHITPEENNTFNWGKVIGFTFAQSNESGLVNSCRLHDIKLVSLEQYEPREEAETQIQTQENTAGILLTWTPVETADSYRIYRRGGGYGLKIFLWEWDTMRPLIRPVVIR